MRSTPVSSPVTDSRGRRVGCTAQRDHDWATGRRLDDGPPLRQAHAAGGECSATISSAVRSMNTRERNLIPMSIELFGSGDSLPAEPACLQKQQQCGAARGASAGEPGAADLAGP